MRRMLALVILLVLAPLVWTGCSREQAPGPLVMDEAQQEHWEIDLVEMRIEKNEAFMDSTQSPLPAGVQPGFEGLNYYFPVPSLRFRLPLVADAGADTVLLVKRKGEQVPYLRRGRVTFRAGDIDHTLSVFGPADTGQGDFLWLPFYDETSGGDTYGGGRYLDLEVAADGTVEVDFNYAYNPLCDYNPEKYNCTLPPDENRLSLAIEAGEKTLGAGH